MKFVGWRVLGFTRTTQNSIIFEGVGLFPDLMGQEAHIRTTQLR